MHATFACTYKMLLVTVQRAQKLNIAVQKRDADNIKLNTLNDVDL